MTLLAKILALRARIGVPCGTRFWLGNDSWVDYQNNGYWNNFDPSFPGFPFPYETAVQTEEINGHLIITPDPSRSDYPEWQVVASDYICLAPGEIYWRWEPWGQNNWVVRAGMYGDNVDWLYEIGPPQLGGEGEPTPSFEFERYVELFGASFLQTDDDEWTRATGARWVRFKGEADGTLYIQEAADGDTHWTTIFQTSEDPNDLKQLVFYFYWLTGDADAVTAYPFPGAPGWIGPMSYAPTAWALPLKVSVGDALSVTQAKALPLRVMVGDVSP